jgi:NAD(P)-dependent dehydrogenase (short-subunit alcohol dehydrogenase family)
MPTILITGASRGIGLEFTRQFSGDGWDVIAACRNPSAAGDLNGMAGVEVHALDVDNGGSVTALKSALGGRSIDVLLNNAGIIGQRAGFGTLDYDAWAGAMNTNVFGPMRMAEAFADNVTSSDRKQMVFITSRMGSITETSPNAYVYRSSKAALNMAVRCMSLELANQGLTAILFHPGHVSTDMGGAAAPVTPTQSVTGMKQQILGFTQADNGRFLAYDGDEIPW